MLLLDIILIFVFVKLIIFLVNRNIKKQYERFHFKIPTEKADSWNETGMWARKQTPIDWNQLKTDIANRLDTR